LAVFLLNPIATNAGSPIDGPFIIRAESEKEVQPSVAYNSQRQEYLVVFWNDRPGCDDIRAERVSREGKLLGGKWIAAGCPAEHRYPDVAYNTQRNEYLVTWIEESGGVNHVQAQRLSDDLQFLGGVITLNSGVTGAQNSTHSSVAYASTSDNYLVVWEHYLNLPGNPVTHIIGRSVSGNGTMAPASIEISLDTGGKPREEPDLAYNRHANGFLVVWQQWDGNAIWDIYGQLVNGDGNIPPSFLPIQVAWYIQSTTSPSVAAIPTTPSSNKYLVVFEAQIGPGNRDIYGKLVEEDGTPAASHFPMSGAVADEYSPAVVGTEDGQQYLVAWGKNAGVVNKPIQSRSVSFDGVLLDQEDEFSGVAADYPGVAAGPEGDFLVAWQDQPAFATDTNIYGQLWGNERMYVYLPLVIRNP
jgi:hypothetical protein